MYKIEKNIPLPQKKYELLPFEQMEIGDSFKVDSEIDFVKIVQTMQRIYWRNEKKFKTNKKELRIWRIK